jgi:hypothetical protein
MSKLTSSVHGKSVNISKIIKQAPMEYGNAYLYSETDDGVPQLAYACDRTAFRSCGDTKTNEFPYFLFLNKLS